MELLLEELHKIQDNIGYISEESLEELARKRELTKAELYGIASFYSRFYFEKPPKYIIRVCKSISCGINNAGGILQAIKNELGISIDENSKDNIFRLESVECLGVCGEGPIVTINDEVYTDVVSTSIIKKIRELRESENDA